MHRNEHDVNKCYKTNNNKKTEAKNLNLFGNSESSIMIILGSLNVKLYTELRDSSTFIYILPTPTRYANPAPDFPMQQNNKVQC